MSDITERLRGIRTRKTRGMVEIMDAADDAADEIDRLRGTLSAEIKRTDAATEELRNRRERIRVLEEALRNVIVHTGLPAVPSKTLMRELLEHISEIAKAALEQTDD